MTQNQTFETAEPGRIPALAQELRDGGYRLVQLCAVAMPEGTELVYSFDKDFDLRNIKAYVPEGETIGSITPWFWSAFVYENEVHDLFGVSFEGSQLDYKGNFFRVSTKTPWKNTANAGKGA